MDKLGSIAMDVERDLGYKVSRRLRRLCIHEIGHAVIAFRFNSPIECIDMDVKIYKSQIVNGGECILTDQFVSSLDFRKKEDLWKVLVFKMAGYAAEKLFYGRSSLKPTSIFLGDFFETDEFLEGRGFSSKDIKILKREAVKTGTHLLLESYDSVRTLALKLFDHLIFNNLSIKIEGAEIEKFLKDVRNVGIDKSAKT